MRQSIHHYYNQLNANETSFVDEVFSTANLWSIAKAHNIPLNGDDTVERAVDALARAVIESRVSVIDEAIMDSHLANKWTHG